MDEHTADKFIEATHWPRTMAAVTLGVLALFLFILMLSALKEYRFIGSGVTATNTITVSGEGEVFAVPDTATFSVTIQEEAKEVKPAQETATKKSNDIIRYLKGEGIEEKDIRTADYSVYPQYDYVQAESCRDGYCPPGRQQLRGYQVSMTLSVKVRDTEKAGDLLSGVGNLGASSVSGLSFTIDDEDALQADARGKAIEDARTKAAELAKQLNVSLVRVVGFSEGGVGGPIYYAKAEMSYAADGRGGAMPPSPEIPVGENKIVSSVSVTYEIR
ncbi:SIMPL domain-containing protein [Candidatus Kaiserbacteria bacterium]|nr:SIMPL domain-containing protein [Candidatus Kaiserbacteria bacterium]